MSRNGPEWTHLFLADDLVLFVEASMEQLQVVMGCLEHFCKCLGQQINFQKSQLFCSNNVDERLASSLSITSNIPLTTDLGYYLGVPSIHGRVSMGSFGSVIGRMNARLEGWKSRYLSLAVRRVGTICFVRYSFVPYSNIYSSYGIVFED